jgi:hypothetical protein
LKFKGEPAKQVHTKLRMVEPRCPAFRGWYPGFRPDGNNTLEGRWLDHPDIYALRSWSVCSPRADEEITPCKLPSSACSALRSHARWTSAPSICRPPGSLHAARLEIERLMSARHAVLSQGAKQVPPHFLAWPETFGRTDSKRCRRSREINDFHLPPAQTPRTLFRDHYGISEIRRHSRACSH